MIRTCMPLALLALALTPACGDDSDVEGWGGNEPPAGGPMAELPLRLAADAVAVHPDDAADIEVREDELVVPADAYGRWVFLPGQVVVGGSPDQPLLRRILEVEPAGETVALHTAPARLTEAFERFHLVFDTRNPDIVEHGVVETVRQPLAMSVGVEFSDEESVALMPGVEVGYTVRFEPALRGEIDISDHELRFFQLELTGDYESTVTTRMTLLQAEAGVEIVVPIVTDRVIRDVVVWIGWLPVLIRFDLDVDAGVELTASAELAVEAGVRVHGGLRYGVLYDGQDRSWLDNDHDPFAVDITGPELDMEANLSARAYAQAKMAVKFYGLAGPYVGVRPFGQVDVSVIREPAGYPYTYGYGFDLLGGLEAGARWLGFSASYDLQPLTILLGSEDGHLDLGGLGPCQPTDDEAFTDCLNVQRVVTYDDCGRRTGEYACAGGEECRGGQCCRPGVGCFAGNVYEVDSCGNVGARLQRCSADSVCSGGQCCRLHHHRECSGDELYWYDSCGNRGPLSDVCQDGEECRNGECQMVAPVPPRIAIASTFDQPVRDGAAVVSWHDRDPDSDAEIRLYWKADTTFPGARPNEDAPDFSGGRLLDLGRLSENEDGDYGAVLVRLAEHPELDGQSFFVYATIDDGDHPPVYSEAAAFSGRISFPREAEEGALAVGAWVFEENRPCDDDGIVEAAEDVELRLQICNEGGATARAIRCELTTEHAEVEIEDSEVRYGTLEPGDCGTGTNDDEFDFRTQFANTQAVEFMVTCLYDDGAALLREEFRRAETIPCDGCCLPRFAIDRIEVRDVEEACCDGDEVPESGECGLRLYLYLSNVGCAPATEVMVTLADVDEVEMGRRNLRYADLGPGQTAPPRNERYFFVNSIPKSFAGPVRTDVTVTYGGADVAVVLPNEELMDVRPAPWIYVSPEESNFGVVDPGAAVTVDAAIRNVGTAPFTVSAIEGSAADASFAGLAVPITVQPQQQQGFQAVIDTTGLSGIVSRTLTVESNARVDDDPEDRQIVLHGMVSATTPDVRLTDGTGHAVNHHVGEGIVVWQDTRNGHDDYDIYGWRLADGAEFPICVAEGNQYEPRVGDGVVAWTDHRRGPGQREVYAYVIAEDREVVVAATDQNEVLFGVDGGFVAYLRTVNFGDDREVDNLFVYELESGSTYQVTAYSAPGGGATYTVGSGDMDDGLVVWEHRQFGPNGCWNLGVRAYLTNAQHVFQLTDLPTDHLATEDGRVVWFGEVYDADEEDEYEQVLLWENFDVRQVTTELEDHEDPVIGDHLVVYEKHGVTGLVYWNLNTGEELLATDMANPNDWSMDGHLLVWENGHDLYYKLLDQGDLAVAGGDLVLSADSVEQGEEIEVTVAARNVGSAALRSPVTFELLEQRGDQQVALAQPVISAVALAPRETTQASFEVRFDEVGEHVLVARANVPDAESAQNNAQTATVTVRDDDTEGPVISDVSVSEAGGDGDGYLEAGERLTVRWTADDPAGVTDVAIEIDGEEVGRTDGGSLDVGPLDAGEHDFSVQAWDADDSPAASDIWETAVHVHPPHPSILGTHPAAGTTEVGLQPLVTVQFDVPLERASVTDAAVRLLAPADRPVPGRVRYREADRTLEFLPGEPLANGVVYRVRICCVEDDKGDALPAPYIFEFTTLPDRIPPVALLLTPVPDAILRGVVTVTGTARDDNFASYQLFHAPEHRPGERTPVSPPVDRPVQEAELATWPTGPLTGDFLLTLVATDASGNLAESTRRVLVDNAAPTLSGLRREPPDLHEHHDGAFAVLAVVQDVGAGLGEDAVSARAWLDGEAAGAWTPLVQDADGSWRYEVVDLDWDALGGRVLHFEVRAEDRAGNAVVVQHQEPIDERNDSPVLQPLPGVEVAENDGTERALDLWEYASDEETATVDLEMRVESVADQRVLAAIDANRYLDVEATGSFVGRTSITVVVSDGELEVQGVAAVEVLPDRTRQSRAQLAGRWSRS